MNVRLWVKPFETLGKKDSLIITSIWGILVATYWFVVTSGEKKLFPSPEQVWHGFVSLYNEGLVVHVGSSLLLCLQATVISIMFSLIIAYAYPIPLLRPLSKTMSRLRYLPLTGITFYLTILVTNARNMQVLVLVI